MTATAVMSIALLPTIAAAAPGDLRIVSQSTAGLDGNGDSENPSITPDGSKIAFDSTAPNLRPSDTIVRDVFVKTIASGAIALVSSADDGTPANGASFDASISSDGARVAFASDATNLDPADTDTSSDIYIKNLTTGNVTLVSASDSGTSSNGNSRRPSISGNGTLIAFESGATNLDPGDATGAPDSATSADVYVKNASSGDIRLVSTTAAGVKGNERSQRPDMATDGSAVAFESFATNLDPTDTSSFEDVYVKDLATGALKLASSKPDGSGVLGISIDAHLSDDASKVAFQSSAADIDPANTNSDGFLRIYAKDLASGAVMLASSRDDGTAVPSSTYVVPIDLSGDGRRVAFSTEAVAFDIRDTDTESDVFVKDLPSGDVQLASITGGGVKSNGPSVGPVLDGTGEVVAFQSKATNFPDDGVTFPSDDWDIYSKEPMPPPPPPQSRSADQTTLLEITDQEEGVLSVSVAQGTVAFGSVGGGRTSPSRQVGDLTYTNTLGTGQPWGTTVAATSLVDGAETIPFTGITFSPGSLIKQNGSAVVTVTPGSSGSFTGADPTPGTSFSTSRTLAIAESSAQGAFLHENSSAVLVVTEGTVAGNYAGTLQYTITG